MTTDLVFEFANAIREEREAAERQSQALRQLCDARDRGEITQGELTGFLHDAYCLAEGVTDTCSIVSVKVADAIPHRIVMR